MNPPDSATVGKTPLYDLHVELGGKMVPFAGYAMPVQYPSGILTEHGHTRSQAGLFDVSHMGQMTISGAHAAAALEVLVPGDIVGLELGRMRYTLFTNDAGGILDDLMVANSSGGADDRLSLVVNAANKYADLAHLQANLGGGVTVVMHDDLALLALQGPMAVTVLGRYAPDCAALAFMSAAAMTIGGIDCIVSRSGYTGEDGFEISLPGDRAEALARLLLAEPEVALIGLGARDSLRLEAGLCLHGHDIDPTTTPIEAGLRWTIAKRRQGDGGFPGAAVIQRQLAEGALRRARPRAPANDTSACAGASGAQDRHSHPQPRHRREGSHRSAGASAV